MTEYIGLIWIWSVSAFLFYNAYYGIRFPEKYIKASWTLMRGLSREDRDSASTGAAFSALFGAMWFGAGLLIVHDLLTHASAPLPPLP